MGKQLGRYGCSDIKLNKKIEDLKKVISLKEEYDKLLDASLDDRLKIINQITAIFPKVSEYDSSYSLLLKYGSEDECLKDIYESIMPVSMLLHEIDEDLDIHRLRIERIKENLIDIYKAIFTNYFKDGTRLSNGILNNSGKEVVCYDWVELAKRLPFMDENRSVYYDSCLKIMTDMSTIRRKPSQRIDEYIIFLFLKSDDTKLIEIGYRLKNFMLYAEVKKLELVSLEQFIEECVDGVKEITINTDNHTIHKITLTEMECMNIFEYMQEYNLPLLKRVYNELLRQYAKIKFYCKEDFDIINLVFFAKEPINLSILERIDVLEYLRRNGLDITKNNYSNQINKFIFRKECIKVSVRDIGYTDEEFIELYTRKTRKDTYLKAVKDLQRAALVLTNDKLSFQDIVVEVLKIYGTKDNFDKRTATILKHLYNDKKLDGFDKLITIVSNFFVRLSNSNNKKYVDVAKIIIARDKAILDDKVRDAYELVCLYITFDPTKGDDEFCYEEGITDECLSESAELIKRLWKDLYQQYLNRREISIELSLKKNIESIIEVSKDIENGNFTKPSDILAKMPLKENFDKEIFRKYAYLISGDNNIEDINMYFGFDKSIFEVQTKYIQSFKIVEPKKNLVIDSNLLYPDSLKGRVLSIARKIDISGYKALEVFFNTFDISVYDSLQETNTEREKLLGRYKNSIMGKLPKRSIGSVVLEECVLEFSEDEVTDILNYMDNYSIPFRDDTFKLVAQEYKTGLISREEIDRSNKRYCAKVLSQRLGQKK